MVALQLSELKSSVSILRKQTLSILTERNKFCIFLPFYSENENCVSLLRKLIIRIVRSKISSENYQILIAIAELLNMLNKCFVFIC